MSIDDGHKPDGFENSTNNSSGVATESSPEFTHSRGAEDTTNTTYDTIDPSGADFVKNSHLAKLFSGWQGIFVMLGGVILPGILIVGAFFSCYERVTLLILKHPLETIVEISLAMAIPIGNYIIWSNLVKCDYRAQIKRGLLSGVAFGSSAIITLVSLAAMVLRYPTISSDGTRHGATFFVICGVFFLAATVSAFLITQVKNTRIVESGKIRSLIIAALGVALAVFGFVASETKETALRVAEQMATNEDDLEQQAKGMEALRWFNPRKELNMECANAKAGGLPGLFIRLDNVTLRQLFFRVTGEPFRDDKSSNFSTMPDHYLQKHVVGAPVSGMSLHRSKMLGHINPETLSSTIYWNFVFKNKNYTNEEARVELGLPEGAVVSGMTVWKDGTAQGTLFQHTGMRTGYSNGQTVFDHNHPGAVTDLGRGRVLMHCYPVPAQGQLRAAVAITVPLKLQSIDEASLPLPRIIDANFSMKGEHSVRMISTNKINLNIDEIKPSDRSKEGRFILSGRVKGDTISGAGISVQVDRPSTYGPVAVKDSLAKESRYVIQTIKKLPAVAPQRLMIVLDGSESVKSHYENIKEILGKIDRKIDTSVILASKYKRTKVMSLDKALTTLSKSDFVGGQDNLESVVKASELAGESKDGAVLWIHGPQPSFNKEIYILSPYTKKPTFYELALDNGIMNSSEFFKHHKNIGPFNPIARSGLPSDDLNRFLAKWRPGGHEFVVEYRHMFIPAGRLISNPEQQREVAAMYARERCALHLTNGELKPAIEEAVMHRIVTPVSLAATVLNSRKETTSALAEGMHNRSVHIVANQSDRSHSNSRSRLASTIKPKPHSEYRWQHGSSNLIATNSRGHNQVAQPTTLEELQSGAAPILQGATNGTIGPQGADATAIMGVNTAGTVRVNNLANLEALLNIFANCVELLGLIYGGAALISLLGNSQEGASFFFGTKPAARLSLAIVCITTGLGTPGTINWFVASARDSNLFS